ncbi:MAG: hypothetical protein M1839_005986 [Geoglossum umbratile]|nr:MAG: hypothetical protein M1839_005986 [Geoglossum umbratile]
MANTTPITFSPAVPVPLVFDVQERIEQLRSYLDPSNPLYQPEPQHINIKAAITLYEDGKLDGLQRVYVTSGKVVIREGYYISMPGSTAMGLSGLIIMKLTPGLGGDGTVYGITAMNDTGSDVLTIFDVEMPHLGIYQGYAGWLGPVMIVGAGGVVGIYPKIRVQVQLVRDDNTPWSDWVTEDAMVRPIAPGVPRLSGLGIREALY